MSHMPDMYCRCVGVYVNWCMLSTGDVICGVWETRCNYPFQALLLCTKVSDYTNCVLIKCKEFRKKFKAATLTPGGRFDEDLVKRYVMYVCMHECLVLVLCCLHICACKYIYILRMLAST